MTSTIANLSPLGDSKHGGGLFTLPRKIRDEIFRLLVKGKYLVPRHTGPGHKVSFLKRETFDEPNLVVVWVSKAVSHEAQQVLYSESIFRYEVPFYTKANLQVSQGAANSIGKLELHIRYGLQDALTTYRHNRSGDSWISPPFL